jgi:hypothetical protein
LDILSAFCKDRAKVIPPFAEDSMANPVKGDVQNILAPYHQRIRRVVERAWAEWCAVAAFRAEQKFGALMYSRTVANYVFDAIARIAVNEFAADPAVNLEIEAQTIKFFFKGSLLARFKKGDDSKLGQNIPTQAALAFAAVDGLLPGMPPEIAKVEFIWLANEIHTRLEHVLVVARDGDRLLWDYEIEAEEGSGSIIPFRQPPSAPLPPANEELVKPRTPDVKKSEEKE